MFNKLSISTLLAIASMASASSPFGGFRPPSSTPGRRRNSKPQPNKAGSKLAKKFAKNACRSKQK